MAERENLAAFFNGHPPLNSVGIVCLCEKSLTSMEGVAVKCPECGRIWLISAMLLVGRAAGEEDAANG